MKPNFTVGVAALAMIVGAGASDSYATYHNDRYGYRVLYPTTLVTPLPEAPNGDGRKWKSRDGKITLSAWGENNVFDRTLHEQMNAARRQWMADHARITYTRLTPEFYVLSGTTGGEIFYEKTVPQADGFATMLWQFPKARRPMMDAIVTRTSHAFKATRVKGE